MSSCVCRFCGEPLTHTFVDLGLSPPCQNVVRECDLPRGEMFYPLRAYVCARCFLVQLPEHVAPDEIFSDYAYFSSYSTSWVDHARRYVGTVTERFGLGPSSLVMEIASNDGYLLQHFVSAGVPVLGVEPAANVAAAAVARGVPSLVRFFGTALAEELAAQDKRPDLLVGNNVLAHVPDINDFVRGMKRVLAGNGVITMEFPHLQRLMDGNQFDTIYHEHYSYLSFVTVVRIFAAHGLEVFDVEALPTHGGSLRIYAQHAGAGAHPISCRVAELRTEEIADGFETLERYLGFGAKVESVRAGLLSFLLRAREAGNTVVGYGAPGKGNTLLNYCGIRSDLLAFTVDRNPVKQGTFTPGTRVPIRHPDAIREARPDYVLLLPWNLRNELVEQLGYIREWGGRFVVPIPQVEVF
jgi:SAM-dependent methyltransferase